MKLDWGKYMRRMFCAVMLLLMMISCAYAQEDVFAGVSKAPADDFTYSITDDACTITKYNGKASVLVVPEYIENCPVLEIGSEAFQNNQTLTAVKLPQGLISIGDSAFFQTSALTQVMIPSSVKEIGIIAFQYSGITEIDLRQCSMLTELKAGIFSTCKNLTTVKLPKNLTKINANAFNSCSALKVLDIPDRVNTIGYHAFADCTSLISVAWPIGWTVLTYPSNNDSNMKYYGGPFNGCTALKNTVIPEGATVIPPYALKGSSVETVTLSSTLTKIGKYAFSGITTLKRITMPSSLKTLDYYVFEKCSSLESVDMSASTAITEIPYRTFASCTALSNVILPESLKKIGMNAFDSCSSLKKIKLLDSIESIAFHAFENSGLEEVICPAKWQTVYISGGSTPASPFSGCSKLKRVVAPQGVTQIAPQAFRDCRGLTEVLVSDTVKVIGQEAFRGCTGLTKVHIPDSVKQIGASAFSNCGDKLVIMCYSGSAAHVWAENNDVAFELYDKHEHEYAPVKGTDATCLKDGAEIEACSICGYQRVIKVLPALGHSKPESFTTESKVSCDTDGVRTKRCPVVLEEEREPMTGHAWSDWVVVSGGGLGAAVMRERGKKHNRMV